MKEEITEINGIKFQKVSKKKKPAKTEFEYFSTTEEAKIIPKLNKLVRSERVCLSEEEAINRDVCAMDPANCCMVSAISVRAKMLLRRYISPDDGRENKTPDLNYGKPKKEKMNFPITSKYSKEYMLPIVAFFDCQPDEGSIQFFMKKDYPLTIQNVDWKIIVAPRVDND